MLRSLAISSQVCAKGKRDISRGDYVRKADQYRIVDLGGGGQRVLMSAVVGFFG